jgi:hypothetical protein
MPRCSAAGLHFRLIPAGFNAPLEFLTGFTSKILLPLSKEFNKYFEKEKALRIAKEALL